VNRKVLLAAAFAASIYFPLAYYFAVSYVEEMPRGAVTIKQLLPSATPGTFYAHVWLPGHVTKATIYENGVSIGSTNAIYDDLSVAPSSLGSRWKYLEFNSRGDQVRRWIVFADAQK